MVVSLVSGRTIAALRKAPAPKEARCIAFDRNEVKECEALAAIRRSKVLRALTKDAGVESEMRRQANEELAGWVSTHGAIE